MPTVSKQPIRAIFFDLDDTLAGYQPSLEGLLLEVCQDAGIELTPQDVRRGWLAAGAYWRRSVAQRPLEHRSERQLVALYTEFDWRTLNAAGLDLNRRSAYRLFTRMLERFEATGSQQFLYQDVLPALAALKARGLTLGVVTNRRDDLPAVCGELGILPLLDVIMGPEEAGVSKPHPGIFRAALRRVGVAPQAAVHVGDHPQLDVAGARRAGLRPMLVDRFEVFSGWDECQRVASLAEVAELISQEVAVR